MNCRVVETDQGRYCEAHQAWHTRTDGPLHRMNVGIKRPVSDAILQYITRKVMHDNTEGPE